MARVTVEDCIDKIPNRYELLMVAAQRAKDISAGAPLTVMRDNDKNSVVALREIADSTISLDDLDNMLVTGFQKVLPTPTYIQEDEELKAVDEELALDEYAEEAAQAMSGSIVSEEGDFSEAESFQVTENPDAE